MATDALLLKFKDADTLNSVTRSTVKQMARVMGFNESQVIQLALAKLRAEVIPAYLPDDGPVSQTMIRHLHKTESQDNYKPTRTLFPGV